jgi:transcriptional regulator with XRE-family HTH domain
MPSFQISITPNRRAAARFVTDVRRKILKALEEENKKRGLKQTDLARAINVHRSVINRELRGKKDMPVGRVAELGWALGRIPTFNLPERVPQDGSNLPMPAVASGPSISGSQDKPFARNESNAWTTEPLRNVTVKVLDDAPV